jgi:hypothetical protein
VSAFSSTVNLCLTKLRKVWDGHFHAMLSPLVASLSSSILASPYIKRMTTSSIWL